MDIFKKLGVKSAFKCVTHNLDGQLDYVLMRNDIQSNKQRTVQTLRPL